jgi:LysM repeat protein
VALETEDERMVRTHEMATVNHDLRVVLEERQKLLNAVEAGRQETAALARQVGQLNERVQVLEQQLTAADATHRGRVQALQDALAREQQARQTAVEDVVKSVSRELAASESRLQEQHRQVLKALSAPPASGGGAVQGEYVVQKGDTLATIARAVGISVESLQRANNLSGTTIFPGQKLLIPAR